MRTSTAFSILAVAGSALAAPRPVVVENVHVIYETVVHTVYATEGQSTPTPVAPFIPPVAQAAQTYDHYQQYDPKPSPVAPKSSQAASKPRPTTTTEAYTAPTSTQTYAAPPVSTEVPATPSPAAPEYLAVVNEWRGKLGLTSLAHNDVMEDLAKRTVYWGAGQMKHNITLPSNGEVLAPGDAGVEGFKKVFVGGWLCEISSLPGLNGVCDEMSKGWAYEGQTGHAEILTGTKHKTVGCALKEGIWCCEFSGDDKPEWPAKLEDERYLY